jgi:hypothetical protein
VNAGLGRAQQGGGGNQGALHGGQMRARQSDRIKQEAEADGRRWR